MDLTRFYRVTLTRNLNGWTRLAIQHAMTNASALLMTVSCFIPHLLTFCGLEELMDEGHSRSRLVSLPRSEVDSLRRLGLSPPIHLIGYIISMKLLKLVGASPSSVLIHFNAEPHIIIIELAPAISVRQLALHYLMPGTRTLES